MTTISEEEYLRKLMISLEDERDKVIDNYNQRIKSLQNRINLITASDLVDEWVGWVNIKFKTAKASEDYMKWFSSQVTLEDITCIRGSYRGKYEKTKVLTIGYLKNVLLYSYTANSSNFIDSNGWPIKVEDYYPAHLKTLEEFKKEFLKLRKSGEWEDDDMKDFVMIHGFVNMIKEMGTEKVEPWVKEDFSRWNY